MSLDATRWAWMQSVGRSAAKLVLLSLADRAGENHTAYPSLERLHKDTELDHKTIRSCIEYLISISAISRKSSPGKVPIYTLNGVEGREQTPPKSGTPAKIGTTAKSGTTPLPKTAWVPLPKLVPEPTNEPTNEPIRAKNVVKRSFDKKRSDEFFSRFWNIYPRKTAKATAEKAWAKISPDLADLIIADVTRRRIDDPQWRDVQFIPHPSTYLNQRRWEDEIVTQSQEQTDPPRRRLKDYADAH